MEAYRIGSGRYPIFDGAGRPVHERGVVPAAPGLAFVGLSGQFALSSDVIPGAGRDAGYVVKRLAAASKGSRELAAASA